MSPEDRRPGCAAVEDDLPALAIGSLSGKERAAALAHVDTCPRCANELEQLTAVADATVALAPSKEPPVGFEVRLSEALGFATGTEGQSPHARPQRTAGEHTARRRAALGVAAGVVAVGLAFGAGYAARGPGAPTVASATAHHQATGTLRSVSGSDSGSVLIVTGHPGWVVMTVHDLSVPGQLTCEVVTADGSAHRAGTFWLDGGYGDWVSRLPVPATQVRSARLVGPSGRVVAEASIAT